MMTAAYWRAALERALTSAAAAALGTGVLDAAGAIDVPALQAVGVTAAVAFCVSIVKGLAANAANGGVGPGLGRAEVTQPAIPLDDGEGGHDDPAPAPEVEASDVGRPGEVDPWTGGGETWSDGSTSAVPDDVTAARLWAMIEDADDVTPTGREPGLVQADTAPLGETPPLHGPALASFTSAAPQGLAARVIDTLKGQVGFREGRSASGSWNNRVPFGVEQPGMAWSNYQAWCATFVSWGFFKNGGYGPIGGSPTAAVAVFRDRARKSGRFSEYPAVGAILILGSSGVHTGVVYAYDDTHIFTVEGNTNENGSREGNGVYLKRRARASVFGYYYPEYPEGIMSADPSWRDRAPKRVPAAAPQRAEATRAARTAPPRFGGRIVDGKPDAGTYGVCNVAAFNAAMSAGILDKLTGRSHGAEREVWAVEVALDRLNLLAPEYARDRSAGTSTQDALDRYRDMAFPAWPLEDRRGEAGPASLNALCFDAGIRATWV